MSIKITAFQIPKSEADDQRCEDAFSVSEGDFGLRVAVSDGASDSYRSDVWSHALTKAYVEAPPKPDAEEILHWLDVPKEHYRISIQPESLPWNQALKAERGDGATLLGMQFKSLTPPKAPIPPLLEADPLIPIPSDEDGETLRNTQNEILRYREWSALAIGDCFVMQVRDDAVEAAFPFTSSEQFDSTPFLLSTRYNNAPVLDQMATCRGECESGDVFLLATDALAKWILQQWENGEKPWLALQSMDSDSFEAFVLDLRARSFMRDDDVTLLIVNVEAAGGS